MRRLVVDIANVCAASPLVDGDHRSTGAATSAVHSMATWFDRYEVYCLAAVNDREIWERLGGLPVRAGPATVAANDRRRGDENQAGGRKEDPDEVQAVHGRFSCLRDTS